MQESSKISFLYYIIPPILLSFITAVVYYPSLTYNFQFDDIANIEKHFAIRFNTFKSLFFTGTRWLSYWLNAIHYSIGKFDPFSYRMGNLLIHISNGLLIFFTLLIALTHLKKKSFFKDAALPIAFLTTLLFLLHPVQTQTVSYVIQGQLEGISSLFILAMAFCFLKIGYAQHQITKSLCTALLFILAPFSCGTKEITVISPILFLLLDWFLIAQGNMKSFKSRLWIHAIVATLIISIYLWLLKPSFFTDILGFQIVARNNIGNIITQNPNDMITTWSFFISQFKVLLHYLWIFIWPFGISVEYDWVLSRGLLAPDCFLPLIVLLAIGYYIFSLLKKDNANLIAFCLLWFFACMAPRASIIPSPELLVDYKTYLASFGWLLLLATGIIYLINLLSKKITKSDVVTKEYVTSTFVMHGLCLLLAVPLGLATMQRNNVWCSGLNFWASIIKNAPGKARAYNNYGVELSQTLNKFADSIPYFKKAIAMDAKYPDPCNNLAVAYSSIGKIDEAIVALKQGLNINPYYPEGYNNLASFLLMQHKLDQAEASLKIALHMRPYYGKAYFNMGRLYIERGDHEKAWQYFKDSCTKADLDTELGFATYGKSSLSLNKFDDAIFAYTKVLEINPRYPEARFNLANAYYLKGDCQQALTLYDQELTINPQEARVWYNKGETFLKLARPHDALECFKHAQKLPNDMAHLPLRMAACYQMLGQSDLSKQELITLANNDQAPTDVRNAAHHFLNELNKQSKA